MTWMARTGLLPKKKKKLLAAHSIDVLLDAPWYANAHGLAAAGQARKHFTETGLVEGFAPNATLAGPDQRTLAPWAYGVMRRLGYALRAPSVGPLSSSGLAQSRDGATDPEHAPVHADQPVAGSGKTLAVVTSIMGPFDGLQLLPQAFASNADYILITDQRFRNSTIWKTRSLGQIENAPSDRLRSRYPKAHLTRIVKNYDWVLWVDGNIGFCLDPIGLVRAVEPLGHDLYFFRHNLRGTIAEEVAACFQVNKADLNAMIAEVAAPLSDPHYTDDLLVGGNVILARTGVAAVDTFFENWWSRICAGSGRDQLSLPVALKQNAKLNWAFFPWAHYHASPYLKFFDHR